MTGNWLYNFGLVSVLRITLFNNISNLDISSLKYERTIIFLLPYINLYIFNERVKKLSTGKTHSMSDGKEIPLDLHKR